jgi:UDP:flavonoid glycosyltransferase YjiC (YdhE family)
VSGNSSALDALALKKPFLMHPAPGQFEQWYRARSYEALGVARFVRDLTVESLHDFARDCEGYRKRAAEVSVFDNDAVFAELEREIEAAAGTEAAR